jgi:hypothetical protein
MARRELVIACGLIGAFGGLLLGYVFARTGGFRHWHWNLVVAPTVCTAISATALGAFLARPAAAMVVGGRAAWASFLAGSFNGVLMVVPVSLFEPHGPASAALLLPAALFGAVCALPFAPAIVVVAMTAAYADARVDSIAARSQGRRVVRNALVCAGAAAALIGRRAEDPWFVHLPLYVLGLAVFAVLAFAIVELVAIRALGRLDAGSWEPVADGVPIADAVDYGVGFGTRVRRAHDETYRASARVIEARRGDAARAIEVLRETLRGHAVAASACAAATVLVVWFR